MDPLIRRRGRLTHLFVPMATQKEGGGMDQRGGGEMNTEPLKPPPVRVRAHLNLRHRTSEAGHPKIECDPPMRPK